MLPQLRNEKDTVKAQVNTLSQQINMISQQMTRVSPVTSRDVDFWNGVETQQCEKGSFMVGARIGIGPNLNPRGSILCAKVQPIN